MVSIRYAEEDDRAFWYTLDTHLPTTEFAKKMRDKQGYILLCDGVPVGVLRYTLFWDSIPFLNLIFLDSSHRRQGIGRQAMALWEREMKRMGHGMCLVSTQSDEEAQHFYRALGYKDCGCLTMDISGYEQPPEIFLAKWL